MLAPAPALPLKRSESVARSRARSLPCRCRTGELGDYDKAFAWLEEEYKERSNSLQFLKVHPFYDPVREDPRFKDLVRRVGLN